jgi:large subunit ribosomal protein L11
MKPTPKKKIVGYIKLQILAGKATAAPPVGPALGQRQLNIMEFCKAFNARTSDMPSDARIPVKITVHADKTFSFEVTQPTASYLLRKAAGLPKGSSTPGRGTVGSVTHDQLQDIAKQKMADMNAFSIEQVITMLQGTAKSMGIEVKS